MAQPNQNTRPLTLDDLDDLDAAIVVALQEDGRQSNARIARRLGVSEPTVRKRIERLIRDGFIKVTATIDPRRTPYAVDVIIAIKTRPGSALAIARELAGLEETVYVGYTTGRYDLIVEVLLRTDEDLLAFLTERLPTYDGILSTETFHVVHTGKINYDWKLPAEFLAGRRLPSAGAPRDPGRRRARERST